MSLRYLPEHAENALLALARADKEVAHLRCSHRTLFAQVIDMKWVGLLAQREDKAEKVEAFASRFGRLQDHIGDKLSPRFSALFGQSPKTLLDVLSFGEKMEWINSSEDCIGTRRLRSLLVHEYMSNPQLFLEALLAARDATEMLFGVVEAVRWHAKSVELIQT